MQDKFENRKMFSFADCFIVVLVLLITFIAVFLIFSKFDNDSSDISAVVRMNGSVVDTISLNDLHDELNKVYGDSIKLNVVFNKDGVEVADAECLDKACVHKGKISTVGQSIICVPARITIILEGKENLYDAVVS